MPTLELQKNDKVELQQNAVGRSVPAVANGCAQVPYLGVGK